MEHEGSKQGLYTDIKKYQLGTERYAALEKRARATGKQQDAIRAFMVWCYLNIEETGDIIERYASYD